MTPWLQTRICQRWWPGTIVTVAIFFGLNSYFRDALEPEGQVSPLNRPVVYCFLRLAGVKSSEELAPKFPIDSDRALCFYLVEYYHTNLNKYKRMMMWFTIMGWVVGFVILFLLPLLSPGFDSWGFIANQMSTLLIIALSISHSLRAPVFKVDYRAHQKKKGLYIALDKERDGGSVLSELKSLASAATSTEEAEGLRFLKHEDPNGPAQASPAPGAARPNYACAAGAAAFSARPWALLGGASSPSSVTEEIPHHNSSCGGAVLGASAFFLHTTCTTRHAPTDTLHFLYGRQFTRGGQYMSRIDAPPPATEAEHSRLNSQTL